MENRQFEAMLSVAQERLAQRVPEKIAQNAGAVYADGAFHIRTLGQTVTVRLSECTVQPPLSMWHTLTLLHYLDLADGTRPSGKAVPFSQYPGGMIRGGGLDRDAERIIQHDLGALRPEELARRCSALGAEILESNADFCARFDFAPYYPVWLKVWFADEEFPASGRLFVDETAPCNLTIEDAVTVGLLLLDHLNGARHWTK